MALSCEVILGAAGFFENNLNISAVVGGEEDSKETA